MVSAPRPAKADPRPAAPEGRSLEEQRIVAWQTEHRLDGTLARRGLPRNASQAIKPLLKLLHSALLARKARHNRRPHEKNS